MRQQQFDIAMKADDRFVLGMRLWRMFVRYISQCPCSLHSLQRPVVCYLVLGWPSKRVEDFSFFFFFFWKALDIFRITSNHITQ